MTHLVSLNFIQPKLPSYDMQKSVGSVFLVMLQALDLQPMCGVLVMLQVLDSTHWLHVQEAPNHCFSLPACSLVWYIRVLVRSKENKIRKLKDTRRDALI